MAACRGDGTHTVSACRCCESTSWLSTDVAGGRGPLLTPERTRAGRVSIPNRKPAIQLETFNPSGHLRIDLAYLSWTAPEHQADFKSLFRLSFRTPFPHL